WACAPGTLLAVACEEAHLETLLTDDCEIAAVNGRRACVAAGPTAAIEALEAKAREEGLRCQQLATSHAFHSRAMAPASERMAAYLASVEMAEPNTPIVSSMTGDWLDASQACDPAYWAEQLRRPVRFAAGCETLAARGPQLIIEVGPGDGLAARFRQLPEARRGCTVVASLPGRKEAADDVRVLLASVARAWVHGASVDWSAFYSEQSRRRVAAPTYAFNKRRHWLGVDAQPKTESGSPMSDSDTAPRDNQDAADGDRALSAVKDNLLSMFCELLGGEPDDIDTAMSFVELGADSLIMLQASQAIEERFGCRLPFRQLFAEVDTIDAVASHVLAENPALVARYAPPSAAEAPAATVAAASLEPVRAQSVRAQSAGASNGSV
ncbi:MAG: acyltransferase domain-containing protein, partial [Myxococcota bacterium]